MRDTRAVVEARCSGDLLGAPNAHVRDNNADDLVVQALLERMSGQPFAALLAERVLDPLGMRDSEFPLDNEIVPRFTSGYEEGPDGAPRPEDPQFSERYGAAGVNFGTATDPLRWNTALQADRLLTHATRDVMSAPEPSLCFVALGSWMDDWAPDVRLVDWQGALGRFYLLNLQALGPLH